MKCNFAAGKYHAAHRNARTAITVLKLRQLSSIRASVMNLKA